MSKKNDAFGMLFTRSVLWETSGYWTLFINYKQHTRGRKEMEKSMGYFLTAPKKFLVVVAEGSTPVPNYTPPSSVNPHGNVAPAVEYQ